VIKQMEPVAINMTIEHLTKSLFENKVINYSLGTELRTITIWAYLRTQDQRVENCRQAGAGDAIYGFVSTYERG
jgi:hypothetical protein